MTRTFGFAALIASSLLAGCATHSSSNVPGEDELGDENGQDGESPKSDAAHDNFGFVSLTKSAFNCNGLINCTQYEIARVNRTTIVCADGKTQASCTVGGLDISRLPEADQPKLTGALERASQSGEVQVLAKGELKQTTEGAIFVANEVWLGQMSGGSTDGTWVRAYHNGNQCIQAPCPMVTEERLNSNRSLDIVGLDWGQSNDYALEERVDGQMLTADGVIIVGTRTQSGPAGAQYRSVDQVFLPLLLEVPVTPK